MMNGKSADNPNSGGGSRGVVLLVTLVILVVLASVGYFLTSLVSAQRRRSQYIIDYQAARYACDSAAKYALTEIEGFSPELIKREGQPDFSDLFCLSREEYQELKEWWAEQMRVKDYNNMNTDSNSINRDRFGSNNYGDKYGYRRTSNDINSINDINDINAIRDYLSRTDFNEPDEVVIPGPYGPAWPYIISPNDLMIGSAHVRIEVEDENAKYPIGWMLMDDETIDREVLSGFETFCEWMDANEARIYALEQDFADLRGLRPFKVKFKEQKKRVRIGSKEDRRTGGAIRHRIVRKGRKRRRYRIATISPEQQIAEQAVDFSRIFNSSMVDQDLLREPTIETLERKESLLKYMGIWGTTRVNINTAPRHVLEAAFSFGGDAAEIADAIIRLRKIKPFENIEELKKELMSYRDSIDKCVDYITTESNFFTIRVTAVSGAAEASTVIGIFKQGNEIKKIAMISS